MAELFNKNSPISKDPLGPGTSTWVEGYLEPGLGGIFQLGDYPLYPYGAVTYLVSGTHGHDIYNSGTWGHGEFERLYGGFIYDLPGKGNVLDLSVGKQIYQLQRRIPRIQDSGFHPSWRAGRTLPGSPPCLPKHNSGPAAGVRFRS